MRFQGDLAWWPVGEHSAPQSIQGQGMDEVDKVSEVVEERDRDGLRMASEEDTQNDRVLEKASEEEERTMDLGESESSGSDESNQMEAASEKKEFVVDELTGVKLSKVGSIDMRS